jgi:hypothetical protein
VTAQERRLACGGPGPAGHPSGEIPAALGQVGPDLLAADPDNRTIDIVAVRWALPSRPMTDEPPLPPLTADERVSAGTEREVLATFLDLYRGIVAGKLAGLDDQDARRRMVPSATTLLGLVKHLTAVEREWFGQVLEGGPPQRPPGDGFTLAPDDTVAGVLADYRTACARSRTAADARGLDDTVRHGRLGTVSLRWIYVHMIEETARHAGHADILREQTDGSTGFD